MASARPRLSTREVEVVGLVIQGRSTAEIADLFTLSPDTMKTHLKNIFRKCQVHSRAELTAWKLSKEQLPPQRLQSCQAQLPACWRSSAAFRP